MNNRFVTKKGDFRVIKKEKNITKDEKPSFLQKLKGYFKK